MCVCLQTPLAVSDYPSSNKTKHNKTQHTNSSYNKHSDQESTNTKLVQHFIFVKDGEKSKKERQSQNTEMSKNVGSIHVRVLGFTRQGLGLKDEEQLVMDHSSKQPPPHTHRPIV
jgi:hypothetical protein